ncbi:MAG: MATE family efflux transporter [Bacteroidales bacterium]|nr:MATE family efflux transporter [Bacteroidales bacterium]MBO7648072.1 MATE family efflux transporter [Bacteroidales bacterium]MCR4857066.1 MATE family efflux transporter [Bacteroidales bacterium]
MPQQLSVTNKEIWQITYPIIFGNLAQTIIVFVNTVFLGHVGKAELGAAMMAGLYYLIFTTILQGFSVGVQIMVARRLGEGNLKQIGSIFEHGFLFNLLLGIVMLVIIHFCTPTLLGGIIHSPHIHEAALRFINFRQWGILFVSMNFLFRALYVGLSNTTIITYTTLAMAVVNIFFDYSLIFGHFGMPQMGVAGAGLSSVLAEATACIFFFLYTFFKLPYKTYGIFSFKSLEWPLLGRVLRISVPTMFQRLFSFGTWFLFFALIEHLGEEPMAISGIVRSVFLLGTLTAFAYGACANTVTSRLIGAGLQDEVPHTLRRILKLSLLTLLPILLLLVIFPKQVAALYTEDLAMAARSVPALYVVYITSILMSVTMVYFEFISGTGKTLIALYLETGALVFYTIYIYLATEVFHLAIQWVWTADWIYTSLMLVGSIIFLKVYPWKTKNDLSGH